MLAQCSQQMPIFEFPMYALLTSHTPPHRLMWMIPIHGNRTLRLAKKIHTRIDNLLLDVLLPLDLEETLPLLGESGGLPLSHSLVLDSSGLHLLL